jgi:hypothetical protein
MERSCVWREYSLRWADSLMALRDERWPEGDERRRRWVLMSEERGRRRVLVAGLGVREKVVRWRRRLPWKDLASV